MSQSINISIESNSRTGEYRRKVLSELEKLHTNLIELSGVYGFEASCLSAWKQTFLDTLWSLFSAMLPVKLREQECLLMQPCVLLSDQRCSFLPGESFLHPANAIKVNTVSPLYRCSRASSPKKMWEKYVPFLRLTGEWLLDYGFEIGRKYETYASKNQLILKIGSRCPGSGSDSGSGCGINSDNDNTDTDRNGNVPYPVGDRIGGKNG